MIFSQAAVMLRNAVPHEQSMLLASQPAIGVVSLEQICFSKSSALTRWLDKINEGSEGKWREDVKTMVLCTYSAQRISQDVGWIPLVGRWSSCRLDGARSRARRDTNWVRRQARRRQ